MNDPSLCLIKQTNGQWLELATSKFFYNQRKDEHFFMASGAFNMQKLNCQFLKNVSPAECTSYCNFNSNSILFIICFSPVTKATTVSIVFVCLWTLYFSQQPRYRNIILIANLLNMKIFIFQRQGKG